MTDKYNQPWVLWFAPLKVRLWAITIGQTAYYSCCESQVTESWRQHEDTHKAQWKREGWFKFPLKYIYYHFKYGYDSNPYEVEAGPIEL